MITAFRVWRKDQAECATKIPVEDALPGDLIFYQRSDGYIYSVVMSTGDGGTIEAHSSATGIIESTVNENDAVWAVRIISNEDTDILDALKKKDMAADYYDNAVIAKSTEYGSYLGKFKLTAYCSCPICCGVWSGGPTASGAMPTIRSYGSYGRTAIWNRIDHQWTGLYSRRSGNAIWTCRHLYE